MLSSINFTLYLHVSGEVITEEAREIKEGMTYTRGEMADIKETVTVTGEDTKNLVENTKDVKEDTKDIKEDTNITRKKVEILNGKLHLLDFCF